MLVQLVQIGVPLNDETLSEMTEEERDFWLDFLGHARRVIDEKEREGKQKPFMPPPDLVQKYQKALADYNGARYCQVRQLQQIFAF